MNTLHDFSTLTCRNHQPSHVSQIISRSVLRDDLKSNAQKKKTAKSSSNPDPNANNKNDINGNSTATTAGNTNHNNDIPSTTSVPKRTFYKRNASGALIPLPVSQYDRYESMDVDHHADSSIYILDSAVPNQNHGCEFHESASENIGENSIHHPSIEDILLSAISKVSEPTWSKAMEEEEIAYERKKFKLLNREKAMQWERKEREADLLVSELVAKTNVYAMLMNETTKKKSSKKNKKQRETDQNEGNITNNGNGQSDKVTDDEEEEGDEEDDETDNNGNRNEVILPKLRLSQQKRLQLEHRRQAQEANVPSKFHAIELEPWDSKIDWIGCKPSNGDDDKIAFASDPNVMHNAQNNSNHHHDKNANLMNPQDILSQMRNPELDALDLTSIQTKMNIWEGATVPTSSIKPAQLILHESEAGSSIAWLAVPQKRPPPFNQTSVFDKRFQRGAGPNGRNENGGHSFMVGNEESKEFEQKQRKRSLLESEKKERVSQALGSLDLGGGKGRTITSSLMGPGGTERTGRPSRHENSSSAHDAENVEQLELVYSHTLVKADLRITELRQFHRPRLPKLVVNINHPWKFQLRIFPNLSAAKKKMHPNQNVIGSYMSINSKRDGYMKIRNATDLSPTEGCLVLFEYCEERPPIQLSKGMASKIVNYYRGDKSHCPVSAGGGDRPTRKRAAQVTNTTTISSGKSEKPPKLVGPEGAEGMSWVDLIGIQYNNSKEQVKKVVKEKPTVNVLPEGATELLHPKVHGPFIGEVEQGVTQSGLISNLFAAPIFRHAPEPTDFLMILGKKPNKREATTSPLGVVLRPFPTSTFCVGQIEPRIKVSAPNATLEKDFLKAFVTFQIAKALEIQQRKEAQGLKLDEIQHYVFPNTPHLPNYIRQRLKQVANHDTKSQMWTTKDLGEDDYPGVEALGRSFSPEGVAAYEAARSAIQRLHDLGIRDLDLGSSAVSNVGAAMVYLNAGATAARERKTKMAKMRDFAKRDKGTPERLLLYFDKAVNKLEEDAKRKKHMQSVARFIYEELQLTPWHLTSEFIDVHKHNQGTAMMKLTGLGDPSGRGEAYNFLREIDAKPNKETGNSDGALNAQIKKITGTENDLRRLTMKQMAALLLSYGLAQKDIDNLKRWDRVHVIRDVSTRGDGNQDGLEKSKFARGEKMKLSDQKRMYRERIQEIWRRQISALTSDAGVFDTARGGGISDDADAKETEVDIDDSDFDLDDDDEDEDDFYKSLASEIVDERKAKGVMQSAGGRGDMGVGGLRREDQHETSTEDAMVLMQWQRQREEERKAQERLESARDEVTPAPNREISRDLGRKVIRRKITKTFADGQQKTTFKFIVLPKEVENIKAQKKKDMQIAADKKDRKNEKQTKSRHHKSSHKKHSHIYSRDDSKRVGHAMFEDEDDVRRSKKTNITLQVRQNTRIITTKTTKKKGRSLIDAKAPPKSSSKKSLAKEQKLKEKQRKEKKMMRKRKELDEADLYSLGFQKRGTSNRRERGAARERMPHVMMSQRLEAIRAEVEGRPSSGPFHRPVSRVQIPQYYEIISNPIDLLTIRDKNSRYEYRTTESFLKEFKLMQNNAIRFNGKDSILGEEASEIYEFVKQTLEASQDDFTALEQAVAEQLSGSNRKKKKNNPPTAINTDEGSIGTTANVILDGFQTTVNLGDISTNFDSDSD